MALKYTEPYKAWLDEQIERIDKSMTNRPYWPNLTYEQKTDIIRHLVETCQLKCPF